MKLVSKFTHCRNCKKGHTITFAKEESKTVVCTHCGTHNTHLRPRATRKKSS